MPDVTAAFVGAIPENYDRYLAPLFFNPYADDLVARLPVRDGMHVLEVAAGTGIVTRRLVDKLAGRGAVVGTDLNAAMFAHARKHVSAGKATWRVADGTSLPFDSGSFDAVICQFGIMFFPDKTQGAREAFRVLKPGGLYLLNVWDALEYNPVPRITHETIAGFFPKDPPRFYTVPFSYHDTAAIESLLGESGFEDVRTERVAKEGESPSSADAAIGLIEGNPVFGEIMQRRPEALAEIKAAVAARLAGELGDHPLRVPLRAIVASARRPAP
jgi:ubiquinone/menaquinone biosynthesis C-methylase UbiE